MKPTDPDESTLLDGAVGDGAQTVPERPPAMTPPALQPSLSGYRLGELLGKGGMGEVVLADDVEIGRKVAIKRMHGQAPSPAQVSRFMREAKIQACLEHPAIVPVHEIGRDHAGCPFFTMKRLSGITLSEVIKTRRDPVQRMLRAFADVCRAIEFAHTHHFIHRDLKPSNVMLGDYGEVYVIDWGLARSVGELDPESYSGGTSLGGETQAGVVMGTPGYMSPEQVRGTTVGTATDVYGLGAILFEILAGAPVHPRGEAAIQSTLVGGILSPAASAPHRVIAPELDALCIAALAERPEQRPSARDLAEGIQHYLDGDRDLERRRALAAELLVTARADLDSGDPARRSNAMKVAGRALALDPESEIAAALVGRLMIEPPPVMPPALARRLDDTDQQAVRVQSRVAMLSLSAYFVFVPLNLWMGVRDWGAFAAIYGLVVLAIASAGLILRWPQFRVEVAVLINGVLLVMLTRLTSPFLIAPTLVVAAAMSFAMFPRLQHRPIFVIGTYVCAMIAPLILEATGVWRSTWEIADGRFTAEPTTVAFDGTPAKVFLIAVGIAILVVLPLFVRTLAVSQRSARRQLEIQAWHLSHLMPEPPRD